jgi:hypothetical protein
MYLEDEDEGEDREVFVTGSGIKEEEGENITIVMKP